MKGGGNFNHKGSFGDQNGGGKWAAGKASSSAAVLPPKLIVPLILACSFIYFLYVLSLFFAPPSCPPHHNTDTAAAAAINAAKLSISNITDDEISRPPPPPQPVDPDSEPTGLRHIVFGIGASANLWRKRREYIKIWWRPDEMRGYVWLEKRVKEFNHSAAGSASLPQLKLSGNTDRFPYKHRQGHRSALRISRIVSETVRLGLDGVRWFVMGDDDTVFIPDNLVRVLSKFDHRQPYYIGSSSESHLQNIYFSYGMAYGGGGFAISRPLAEALAEMQDGCIHRYPALYGSDDRIQACMAELGVPLTKHPGFHQYDVYGDLLGLLASHPVAPLVSLHHLDIVQPIFPEMQRADAIRKLFNGPIRLDSAGIMQQSICYESDMRWTVSVSWGFVVQVIRGVMSPREMEMPARTFLNWYRRADYTAYAFNTRPVARNPCQKPYFYYLSRSWNDTEEGTTVTEYIRHREKHPACKWKLEDPSQYVDRILVYKKPDPALWDKSPRRNCCRVEPVEAAGDGEKTMTIEVGVCREGEISQTAGSSKDS